MAALFVAIPLWLRLRPSSDDSEELRKQANIALFQERSDELENELSAGNIDQAQFDSLLLELQQNLLADVGAGDESGDGAHKPLAAEAGSRVSWIVPVLMLALLPVLAYPLYQSWGYLEDVQVMDLFQATVESQGDPQEAQRLIVAIGEYAQEHPDMPWAFYFLAENFAALGLFNEAQIAYERAADLVEGPGEKALILGRVATAMYIISDFEITEEIAAIIEEVRELNPGELSVLQLLAADAERRQDYAAAIENWRLMIQANPNSQMAQQLRVRISEAQRLLADSDVDGAGPVIEVNASLAEGLQLDPGLRVFIAVRNAEREGMPPLAASFTTVAELPAVIRLDNNSAVGPFNLSSADSVTVSALVSFAGTATPSSGDYRAITESFALGEDETVELDIVISERVP